MTPAASSHRAGKIASSYSDPARSRVPLRTTKETMMTDAEQTAIDEQREKLERIAAEAHIVEGQIATVMIDRIMALITPVAKPFTKLKEYQQQDLISSISAAVKQQLHVALKLIAAKDHPTLQASLVDFSVKGTTVKIKLETVKTDANLAALGRVGAGQLDIIFTDLRVIDDASRPVATKPAPDQGGLPLDPEPAQEEFDDTRLAGEPDDKETVQ